MTEKERLEKIEKLNNNKSENSSLLAELYTNLLIEMDEAIIIARQIAVTVDPSEEGIVELQQLLTILDGSFLRKAKLVIQKNQEEDIIPENNSDI